MLLLSLIETVGNNKSTIDENYRNNTSKTASDV